jgi:hypothetical protein
VKFAFDIHGTIDAHPAEFAALMRALRRDGHEVHVLTGFGRKVLTGERYDQRRNELEAVGIGSDCYDVLHLVSAPNETERARVILSIGIQKAAYCASMGIDVHFEDRATHADQTAEVCTTLVVWPSPEH